MASHPDHDGDAGLPDIDASPAIVSIDTSIPSSDLPSGASETVASDEHISSNDKRAATDGGSSTDPPPLDPPIDNDGDAARRRKAAATAFACGLAAGVVQAGVFNPYDRALYLSVKNKRPFLAAENWSNPYLGFAQSVGGRALSGGLFFPLESTFRSAVVKTPAHGGEITGRGRSMSKDLSNFLVGSLAGSANALFLNPLSAVKYRTWGRENNRGALGEALVMWRKAGVVPFFHGFLPTVMRDVAFGGTYTLIRMHLRERNGSGNGGEPVGEEEGRIRPPQPHERQWLWNMGAAAAATVISGPFNLARNVQFATGASKPRPSVTFVLTKLWADASAKPGGTAGFLGHVQRRLRIGWGTFRVAAGMAFGQALFDSLSSLASQREHQLTAR